MCVVLGEEKIYALKRKGEKKNQYFGGGRGLCVPFFFCISEQVNSGFVVLSVILIEVSDAFCFLFL